MRRFPHGILVAIGLFASGTLIADIDKPKNDEQPEPEMGGAGKKGFTSKDHEALHKKLAEEAQDNLKKIAELMEKARGRLAQKETGDSTQKDQQEVVKELQELIDKVGKG
jgi:hypothetical protein